MKTKEQETTEKNFSPLRNETIKVMFVPHPFLGITDKNHALYGGRASGASYTFYASLSNGQILTDDEAKYFEKYFGLDEGAMSVARINDNYWKKTEGVVNSVTLTGKQTTTLNLNKPEDYLKYKILLSNKNKVANGLTVKQAIETGIPYSYTMVSSRTLQDYEEKASTSIYEAFNILRDYYNSAETLNYVLSEIRHQQLPANTNISILRSEITKAITDNAQKVLDVFKDKDLKIKTYIHNALNEGFLLLRDNVYYVSSTGQPVSENGKKGINATIDFLNNKDNQKLLSQIMMLGKDKSE